MEIFLAGFIVIPITLIAAIRKNWSIGLVLFSLPLFGLKPVIAVGHQFTFPEVAIIGLAINQLYRWARDYQIRLTLHPTYAWLVVFWLAGVISVIYLLAAPSSVIVHPYNTGSLDEFVRSPVMFSKNNITQIFLRTFSIGAVILLVINLDQYWSRLTMRWLVLSGICVGVFGVIYQITQIFGIYEFTQSMVYFGFIKTDVYPSNLGPVPRMYTTLGEPGWTALYVLYGLAISATSFIIPDRDEIFSSRNAFVSTCFLLITLTLTTGTTGYGGLVILLGVLFIGSIVYSSGTFIRYAWIGAILSSSLLLVGLATAALTEINIINIAQYQAEKLRFNAGSGTLRIQYIKLSFSVLAERPLLGVGTGSYYGTSLLGTLLAETGIIGFGAFSAAIITAYRSCFHDVWHSNDANSTRAMELLVAGITVLGTALLAKSITLLVFPIFWVCISLPIVSAVSTAQEV